MFEQEDYKTKYTVNPDFEGSEEEAKRQVEEYKAMNRWLAEHRELWKYDDSKIGGFKFLCPLEQVPAPLLEYDQKRKEATIKENQRREVLRKMGFTDKSGSIIMPVKEF